jgi:hypothetical protein
MAQAEVEFYSSTNAIPASPMQKFEISQFSRPIADREERRKNRIGVEIKNIAEKVTRCVNKVMRS